MNTLSRCFFILLLLTFHSSCKKEPGSHDKHCWQLVNQMGQNLNAVCDKTEEEMLAMYPDKCLWYNLDEPKFCWYINNQDFYENYTESYITKFHQCYGMSITNIQKVACDYCQSWYSRQKNTYKPNMTFTYSPVYLKQYCGDTAYSLFQGRVIVLRETSDSLITIQFSNNGIF